jgi:UDP-sulfoquinovose synthase
MRILILGGDGYLGWPTAMRFSQGGHEVHVVDNYLRRRAHEEVGTDTLVPILGSLPERAAAWKEVSGKEIGVTEGDLVEWDLTVDLFRDFQPEAIVHYGEMPSAPYSMRDRDHAVFTQQNNVVNTLNVLWAMRELAPDSHLVKLGTMGEYGTPNIDIEEGYLDIEHNGRKETILFPKLPGSLYHLSKVHDSHNIHFACRMWGIRATDLNQGVVYGKGGQTRGYLNIVDTLQCVELAVMNPADRGDFRVFNQFTEQFSVMELAEIVQRAGKEHGLDVRIEPIENPRIELEDHYYNARHTKLLDLGLEPHLLSETLVESMFGIIENHKDRVITDAILPRDRWRAGVEAPSS